MKDIVKNLISIAEQTDDFDTQIELLSQVRNLIEELASTYNAPSNWRYIAEELEKEYNTEDYSWVYESLQLWDFQTED